MLCQPVFAKDDLIVSSLRIEGLHSISQDEFIELLDIKPGDTPSPDDITSAIKRVFLKGIFDDIEIVHEDNGQLVARVREKNIVGRVTIGTRKVSRKIATSVFSISQGDRYTPETLNASVDALELYLRDSGYPYAVIEARETELGADKHYWLDIMVDEGPPQTIREIMVIGRPTHEVLERLSLAPGDPFDNVRMGQDMTALGEYYVRRGFLAPVVGPPVFKYGLLSIPIDTGKRLDVEVSGNEAFPDKALIELMPFKEEGQVNDDLIAEGVARIKEFYSGHGFSSVQVAPVTKSEADAVKVNFYIHEGKTVRVKSLKVSSGIEEYDRVAEDLLYNRKGRPYTPLRLNDDAKIIANYFEDKGFMEVAVMPAVVNVNSGSALVEFTVNPGNRTIYGNVSVTGHASFTDEEIGTFLAVKPGEPYSEVAILDGRRDLLSLCRQRGHSACSVDVQVEHHDGVADIAYEVSEGDKFFFGRTIISGNRLTDTETIKKHLRFRRGQPLDTSKLIETRQRLLALGLFSTVEMIQMPGVDNLVDIHLKVDELSPGTVGMGLGYGEYEKFRAYMEIGYRNIGGGGNTGSLRLEANSIWKRYSLGYNIPFLFGWDVNSKSLISREERKQENIDTGDISYRVIKNTASTGIIKKVSRRISTSLFYEYTIEDVYDVAPDVILSAEEVGNLAIGSLSPAIYYNSLNDLVEPSKGSLAALTVKHATDSLFSQSEFTKTTVQGGKYRRLTDRVIGAFSLKYGTASLGGGTTVLPVTERFYLGGRNTVRGFPHDSIGPLSTSGTPLGGNHFILANLEFRISIVGGWRTVLFGDCGNVWLEKSEVSTADLRCSTGTGIRYKTPVGPIRLDYGYKLDRQPGESVGEMHFSIGHAF